MEFKAIHDKRRCMLGAVPVEGGVHFSVVCQGEEVNLLLFQDNGRKPAARIPFSSQDKVGDVWNLTLLGDFQNFTYCNGMAQRIGIHAHRLCIGELGLFDIKASFACTDQHSLTLLHA